MIRLIKSKIKSIQSIFLLYQYFHSGIPSLRQDFEEYHKKYIINEIDSMAIDIGAGSAPKNLFKAAKCIGVDLHECKEKQIIKVRVGYESLPFENDSISYITAYDLLEHIPRISMDSTGNPFIFCMNEIYRVLKPGGIFLSSTPIFPFLGAFQDPTHNNIMTRDTIRMYFSDKKESIATSYGVTANFIILDEVMKDQSYVAVLTKM